MSKSIYLYLYTEIREHQKIMKCEKKDGNTKTAKENENENENENIYNIGSEANKNCVYMILPFSSTFSLTQSLSLSLSLSKQIRHQAIWHAKNIKKGNKE
jgi:hypothetical protein